MSRKKLRASVRYNHEEKTWECRLFRDGMWHFSKSWPVHEIDESGFGYVHDSILVEIAHMQDIGYEVEVKVW